MPAPTLTYPILAALSAVFLPFLGFLLSALVGKKVKGGAIALTTILMSLLAAAYVFTQVWGKQPIHAQWHWFTIGEEAFHVGLLLDNTAVLMLLLVALVSLPVHIYSVAYMRGDPAIHRYWTYLSLFCSAMLGLVLADNLLLMYVCWELVGFASYLLIGFWFTKEAAVQANKKAFIINRIGDIGFLIGIGLIYSFFGTLDINILFGPQGIFSPGIHDAGAISQGAIPSGWLTVAGLAFFLGAMAKSAQFPFHVWLPAAMEGPTSVSSLIHAATMVAAGVFLLARIFPVFDDTVLLVIATTGALTAFIAAYFALTQNDIKKILAFSTVSQLGFMMVGIGIGAYHVALFHLVTHAFFKCLLFMGAGAVIQRMKSINDNQKLGIDPQHIGNMGGLRKYMPITFATMVIASLALTGFPLTAGYLSKDALLIQAFEWGALQQGLGQIIPFVLVLVSILTGFYIFRLVGKVFLGRSAITFPPNNQVTQEEVSPWMLVPMVVLACCSLFPLFTIHPLDTQQVWLLNGLRPEVSLPPINALHLLIPLLTTLATSVVAFISWQWYAKGKYPLKATGLFYRLSQQQGYIDAVYDGLIVKTVLKLSRTMLWFDHHVVDGAINGVAATGRSLANVSGWIDVRLVDGLVKLVGKLAWGLGNVLRRSQVGRLQHYLSSLFYLILLILLYHIITQV